MRILFIGNAHRKSAGKKHYGFDTRLHNGFICNNHDVYFFSDRDEVRELGSLGVKAIGRKRANMKLLEIAQNLRPEAIVFTHVDNIFSETFAEIRHNLPAMRVAQVSVDAVYNPNNLVKLRRRGIWTDITFVTTGGPVLKGIAGSRSTCCFIPNFSDQCIDSGRAFAHDNLPYDVACFMTDNAFKQDERERILLAEGLAAASPELCIRYAGWGGRPKIEDYRYIEDLAHSAMGLNLSKRIADDAVSSAETRHLYSSDRIAHFMGNGCLTFTQSGFGLEHLYAPDEIVFFDALPDLTDKVRYYKNNPAARRSLAEKGWRKAHGAFSAKVVAQYIIERLFDAPLSQDYAWPTEIYGS